MMDKMIETLKTRDYLVPALLLKTYKSLKLTSDELVLIIYLLNQKDNSFSSSKIEKDLNLSKEDVLNLISSISSKDCLRIETIKVNNSLTEVINLDNLYEKLSFNYISNKEPKKPSNIFAQFEEQFGRTLSSMEYEIINGWLAEDFSEEIILLALKEAIYNNVTNLKYIDVILYEWRKKGIKTKDDLLKQRSNKKESKVVKLDDYDWLNEGTNNN